MAKLTEEMVAVIKGQLARGDDQMQIGLWHGVNQARVSEIKTGRKKQWRHVLPARAETLPPSPPYAVVTQVFVDRSKAYAELASELQALADKFLARAG